VLAASAEEAEAGAAPASAKGGRSASAAKPGKRSNKQPFSLQPVRGTRDFYPEDLRQHRWLLGLWREVAANFGFSEYDAPVLENLELYLRKGGEEITEQLYNFTDKGDRPVSLRPEMTPSLARMVLQRARMLPFPLKWYSIPQCWRYEKPGKGRNREHYQWNMDIWGVPGVAAEAELLAAVTAFLSRVGLTAKDVKIRVNSRKIISEVMAKSKVPDDLFNSACVALDKFDKLTREQLVKELQTAGLSEEAVNLLLGQIEAASNASDPSDLEAVLGKDSEALSELSELFRLAEAYGYRDWLVPDLSVVRGLAYYTGIVFEAFDRKGEFRAITGGGRYDKLLETFGGENVPAAGFGFGDAVIVELLASKGLLPEDLGPKVDVVVFTLDEALYADAARIATAVRGSGCSAELLLGAKKKPMAGFKYAEKVNAPHTIMLAPAEWERGEVAIRTIATRTQEVVAEADVLSTLARLRDEM